MGARCFAADIRVDVVKAVRVVHAADEGPVVVCWDDAFSFVFTTVSCCFLIVFWFVRFRAVVRWSGFPAGVFVLSLFLSAASAGALGVAAPLMFTS